MKYSTYTQFLTVATLVVAQFSFSAISFADDASVKQGLNKAHSLYQQRNARNLKSIEDAIDLLQKLEGKATDADINYDVLVLEAQALYWKGVHTPNNPDKISVHGEGIAKANAAIKLNGGYAEGYYLSGVHLARWAEASGIIASLGKKSELLGYMNNTMNHMTRNNEPGETFDGYGANRVLGRIYFKLPSMFGGSRDLSLKYLKEAHDRARNVPLNTVYYAETLNSGDATDQALAKKILDELLSHDPKSYNPDRIPETMEEFELARKLRAEI
jgi:hypothetical protein